MCERNVTGDNGMHLRKVKSQNDRECVKSPASEKENVRFLDSPDFENLPDFQTGRDVW